MSKLKDDFATKFEILNTEMESLRVLATKFQPEQTQDQPNQQKQQMQ